MAERPFTVIGVYADSDPSYQRFADVYDADTAEDAEAIAESEHASLIVAGVAEGEIKMEDVTYAC